MTLSPKENGDIPASMMTKRKMMAIQIINGLMSCDEVHGTLGTIAKSAVAATGALLDELAKETK